MLILDGKKLSESLAQRLASQIRKLSLKPKLVIMQVGDLEASNRYIKRKKDFALKIGAEVLHKKYKENIRESKIISDIHKFNKDTSIHGIILQLPIPKRIDKFKVIESINSNKDVDGLTAQNTKMFLDGKPYLIPATTKGIITLLENYKIKLAGKKVVVVGRSLLVGKPTALAFLNKNATVTICHSHTKNLERETRAADILVVATGHSRLIMKKHVSKNQIVVDVGMSLNTKGKVVGDVDFENVKNIVKAMTPVPGGVGPMTVASLFQNLIQAYEKQQ